MKNYTPLAKITTRVKNEMIYRYKSWYKVGDVEFTLPRDLSLRDFLKNVRFFAEFKESNYKKTPENKKTFAKIKKLNEPAKKIVVHFGLNDFSRLALYKETFDII